MKGLDQFLVPYIISQIVAIAILITAIIQHTVGKNFICRTFLLGILYQYVSRHY